MFTEPSFLLFEFAGVGPHVARIADEGFQVYEIDTMPQSRMDQYVARSDYGYYNAEWIDRSGLNGFFLHL